MPKSHHKEYPGGWMGYSNLPKEIMDQLPDDEPFRMEKYLLQAPQEDFLPSEIRNQKKLHRDTDFFSRR